MANTSEKHFEVMQQLGLALQRARTRSGKTQKEVAAEIGVSIPTLRAVEAGKGGVLLENFVATMLAVGVSGRALRLLKPPLKAPNTQAATAKGDT